MSAADDWTRFRGNNGSGIDATAALPTELAPATARWSAELAGPGHSSPVTWGDAVYVTSYVAESKSLVLERLEKSTGQRTWSWSMPLESHPMHRLNNPAASTPAVDQRHVYLLATEPGHLYLLAIDHAGREVWRRDFGNWVAQHGFGTSPIVVDDKVVFINSQEPVASLPEPSASRLIAVSAINGNDVWELPLSGERACYAVPLVHADAGGRQTIVASSFGEGLFAVDATTGKFDWSRKCFEQRIVASPIAAGDVILGNNGSGGGGNYLVALEARHPEHPIRYQLHQSISYVPTLLAHGDLLLMCGDSGVVSCYSLSRGELHWRERLSDGFYASPVSDGRNFFCLDKNGRMFVLAAASEFKLMGRFELGESAQATPAISDGKLLVRVAGKLYCFESHSAATR
jgi:outer membrane protein assembly factor BamB